MTKGTTTHRGARPLIGALALLLASVLAACGSDPYPVTEARDPPWVMPRAEALPPADPPWSERAYRLALCYGGAVNDEDEVRTRAEELCGPGGRLAVEDENTFWNGCGVIQPVKITYVCDPPEPEAAAP